MYVERLIIDIKSLTKSGLPIESYFILQCIIEGAKETLEDYVRCNGKIGSSVFQSLCKDGWIELKGANIIFEHLHLTQKTTDLFKSTKTILDHKKFFKELKEVYPSMAKFNGKIRRLHQDLEGCERKYRSIVDSEELHEQILKCVKLNIRELMNKDGTLEFLPMLSTWINKRNYQAYLPDIENFKEIEQGDDSYNVV